MFLSYRAPCPGCRTASLANFPAQGQHRPWLQAGHRQLLPGCVPATRNPRFTADEKHETELLSMLLREVADGFAVSKSVGMAHRVRQHYALEALPRRFGFEDGEERPETCSGREQPQVLCIRHFGKGEKLGGLRCNPNWVACFKHSQAGCAIHPAPR